MSQVFVCAVTRAPLWGFLLCDEWALVPIFLLCIGNGTGGEMARADELETLVIPVVQAQGCELWGVQFLPQGRRHVLRLFIDREEGVSLEDCEKVSRQVSAVLDVEDPVAGAYTLEVSSPGMDRPLFSLEQYARFIGQPLTLRLKMPYQGRRNFKGWLVAIESDEVVLRVDETEYLLPFESIDKANLIPVFANEDTEAVLSNKGATDE
jgi:ribosome maturation factor RimP